MIFARNFSLLAANLHFRRTEILLGPWKLQKVRHDRLKVIHGVETSILWIENVLIRVKMEDVVTDVDSKDTFLEIHECCVYL